MPRIRNSRPGSIFRMDGGGSGRIEYAGPKTPAPYRPLPLQEIGSRDTMTRAAKCSRPPVRRESRAQTDRTADPSAVDNESNVRIHTCCGVDLHCHAASREEYPTISERRSQHTLRGLSS